MTYLNDIHHRPKINNPTEPTSERKVTNTSNSWFFLILIIIIILLFSDVSNNFLPKNEKIVTNTNAISEQNDNPSPSADSAQKTELTNVSSDSQNKEAPIFTDTATADNATAPATKNDLSTDNNILENIKINILNGSGIIGSAQKAKDVLMKNNIAIGTIGTAKNIYDNSIIYYKTGNKNEADILKSLLPDYLITIKLDDNLTKNINLLLVIGKK